MSILAPILLQVNPLIAAIVLVLILMVGIFGMVYAIRESIKIWRRKS
jgi:hypothetical protein